jgi:hypothetical protein
MSVRGALPLWTAQNRWLACGISTTTPSHVRFRAALALLRVLRNVHFVSARTLPLESAAFHWDRLSAALFPQMEETYSPAFACWDQAKLQQKTKRHQFAWPTCLREPTFWPVSPLGEAHCAHTKVPKTCGLRKMQYQRVLQAISLWRFQL